MVTPSERSLYISCRLCKANHVYRPRLGGGGWPGSRIECVRRSASPLTSAAECNASQPTRWSADTGRSPARSSGLDAAYLSQLIGRTVTSVSVIGGDAGTSSRARLALTGDGVPDSVFVKMAAETGATRLMGEIGILGETETRFYRELSPEVSGVPKSYGSAFDPMTGRYVLVLEDLAVEACEFPDTLHPLTQDQASLIVELLARLHGDILGAPARLGVRRVGRQVHGVHAVMC